MAMFRMNVVCEAIGALVVHDRVVARCELSLVALDLEYHGHRLVAGLDAQPTDPITVRHNRSLSRRPLTGAKLVGGVG